ncbi:MAG: hypothetical protein FWC55_08790 [Firmicutes bacterium]|nr:hypothetical protein [Bacillota bacterium]
MGNVTKIAQIVDGAVNWVFNADGTDNFPAGPGEFPDWPVNSGWSPDMLVDVSGRPEVREGWLYDRETGVFSETGAGEVG